MGTTKWRNMNHRNVKVWEVRDADDKLLRVSYHPTFELSQLQYGQYVRCVADVPNEDTETEPT